MIEIDTPERETLMSRKKHTPKENEQGKYIMIAMEAITKAGDIYTYP